MRKMTMPNFCINFLNKAAKLLPILYDFTVASLADAWIKTGEWKRGWNRGASHPSRMRGLKCKKGTYIMRKEDGRIPRGCVD